MKDKTMLIIIMIFLTFVGVAWVLPMLRSLGDLGGALG